MVGYGILHITYRSKHSKTMPFYKIHNPQGFCTLMSFKGFAGWLRFLAVWKFVKHCSGHIVSWCQGIPTLAESLTICDQGTRSLSTSLSPAVKWGEINLLPMFVRMIKEEYIYWLLTFIIRNTLCILSHFNVLRTLPHTKDSARSNNVITHLDYNPISVLTSGEIAKHPMVPFLIPYSFKYRIWIM